MAKKKQSKLLYLLGSIVLGLVTSAIYDLFKSQPFLTSLGYVIETGWTGIITLFNLNLKLWWILVALIAIVLIFWFILSLEERKTKSFKKPTSCLDLEWRNYRKDVVDDFQYRWDYKYNANGSYDIVNLTAYCPEHNCQVYGSTCIVGGEQLRTYAIDNTRVKLLIVHRIENDIWKEKIETK